MAEVGEARRRPGRPAQLSREQIVEALTRTANLDRLTMRELAGRLGVSHGALYRWARNRDELIDLVSEVMVGRVLESAGDAGPDWRARLARIAWGMHDHFLAVPGYATHLARPHRHHSGPTVALRHAVVTAFTDAGVEPGAAEHSRYLFTTMVVSWLAHQENPLDLGPAAPGFGVFLDVLLRGLPAREPGVGHP
jgi:AcrR family transcriptional regulator